MEATIICFLSEMTIGTRKKDRRGNYLESVKEKRNMKATNY